MRSLPGNRSAERFVWRHRLTVTKLRPYSSRISDKMLVRVVRQCQMNWQTVLRNNDDFPAPPDRLPDLPNPIGHSQSFGLANVVDEELEK